MVVSVFSVVGSSVVSLVVVESLLSVDEVSLVSADGSF